MRWHWLPKVRRLNMWLFAAANGPIMYAFLYYPRLLDKVNPGLNVFLAKHCGVCSVSAPCFCACEVLDVLPVDFEHGQPYGRCPEVDSA
jgi:hypothetical protein